MVDADIGYFILFQHLLCQKGLTCEWCTCYQYNHSLVFISFLTFSKLLHDRNTLFQTLRILPRQFYHFCSTDIFIDSHRLVYLELSDIYVDRTQGGHTLLRHLLGALRSTHAWLMRVFASSSVLGPKMGILLNTSIIDCKYRHNFWLFQKIEREFLAAYAAQCCGVAVVFLIGVNVKEKLYI